MKMFSSRVPQALGLSDEAPDEAVRAACVERGIDLESYLASEHGEHDLLVALCHPGHDDQSVHNPHSDGGSGSESTTRGHLQSVGDVPLFQTPSQETSAVENQKAMSENFPTFIGDLRMYEYKGKALPGFTVAGGSFRPTGSKKPIVLKAHTRLFHPDGSMTAVKAGV